MAKIALPTLFIEEEKEERIYIACKHLEITRTEFMHRAIDMAITAHEKKHGGIMTIQASKSTNLAPDQIGEDEKKELRKKK